MMSPVTNPTSWQDVLAHPAPKDHIVQLYEDDLFLVRTVTEYISAGWAKGGGAILVMTPEHWALVRARLDAAGIDVDDRIRTRRLTVLDAASTLSQFLVGGVPDENLFHQVVGTAIAKAAAAVPNEELRAFGEMVDLLWQRGDLTSAIHLEQLWNELAKTSRFSLFCAYKVSPWDPVLSGQEARGIFREHSHLIPGEDYNRLNRAVEAAMEDALGKAEAQALRPLIAGNLSRLAVMPGAQSTILWLRDNLPDTVEDILIGARRHFEASGAQGCGGREEGPPGDEARGRS